MKSHLILLIFLCAGLLEAQDILEGYVQTALQQNLQVQEKMQLAAQKEFAVRESQKMFGPDVRFLGNYTLAAGGRNISLPVGDLLNPVYTQLNELIEEDRFPAIDNTSVNFLPNNFHDARFRITQPILQPELKYQKWIRQEEYQFAKTETAQIKRELVYQVKTAYFHWMQAQEAVQILDQGLILLTENKRITESLIRNGLAIPSARMRIEADMQHLSAQQVKATHDVTQAAAYFNLLLQRPADTPILSESLNDVPVPSEQTEATGREELQLIESGRRIQSLALELEKKYTAPRLGIQIDAGSQAFGVDWGGYVLAGIGLEIPIWNNGQTQLKRAQYASGIQASQLASSYAVQSFHTQLTNARLMLEAESGIYHSYASQLESNKRYYDETVKRYKEGLANYIELLDARTQVTETQLRTNLAKYQSWLRAAEIERYAASYPIH